MIQVTFLALLSLSTIASAAISFNSTYPSNKPWFDGTIPSSSNVTASCASAYAQSISCDEWLIKSQDQELNEDSALNALCTNTCLAGLQKWRDDVRKECTPTDVLYAFKDGAADAAGFIDKLLDTSKKYIEYLYWVNCVRDLNTGAFCLTNNSTRSLDDVPSNDTENTPEMIAAFCKDSCLTQLSVFLWTIYASFRESEEPLSTPDARAICSGLDTSKYPFLTNSTNTTTTTNGGGNSSNATTNGDNSSNAGRKGIGSVGASAVTVVVAAMIFGLGGL